MKRRNVLNSPHLRQLRKKRRSAKRNLALFAFFLIAFLVTGLTLFSRWGSINISSIAVAGNKVIETESIEASVQKSLEGKYLWLFPKSNFLLFPEGKIKENLEEEFKRISAVGFNVERGQTLKVEVVERVPAYTWCGKEISESAECYFMDETGYIFDKAPFFSGEVYFKFFGAAGGAGEYFFENEFAKFLELKKALEDIDLVPAALERYGDEIKVHLASSGQSGPYLILKSDFDTANIIENLNSALRAEPLKTNFKTKYKFLAYIDLRFGNKVYYLFQ